jgi:hypothetical protein
MRSAAFRALVGFGGTLLALGSATLAVSTATSAVIRVAVRARQRKRLVPCKSCCDCSSSLTSSSSATSSSTPGKRRCCVCRGRRAVRWQPFAAPLAARWTLCPLCAGKGRQACFNCSGTGEVVGSDEEVAREKERKEAAAEAAAAETIDLR